MAHTLMKRHTSITTDVEVPSAGHMLNYNCCSNNRREKTWWLSLRLKKSWRSLSSSPLFSSCLTSSSPHADLWKPLLLSSVLLLLWWNRIPSIWTQSAQLSGLSLGGADVPFWLPPQDITTGRRAGKVRHHSQGWLGWGGKTANVNYFVIRTQESEAAVFFSELGIMNSIPQVS